MRCSRTFGITATLASLLLALGLSSGPARAASTVEITYDLADTTVMGRLGFNEVIPHSNSYPLNGSIAGSMKLRYTSNSSSGMPIQPGPVTLLSFNLTLQDTSPFATLVRVQNGYTRTAFTAVTGTFGWALTASAVGSLTPGGSLLGLSGGLHNTFRANCQRAGTLVGSPAYTCQVFHGLPLGTFSGGSYTGTGPFALAGTAGPYGGAQSTSHTLSGQGPIGVGIQAPYIGGWFMAMTYSANGYRTTIVGREVLREAEGHDPKVIPEPGTLLLIGSGLLGLAAVGRASRRR